MKEFTTGTGALGNRVGRSYLQARTSPYPFTWIKVKNPNYSQAVGRNEWFDRMLSQR